MRQLTPSWTVLQRWDARLDCRAWLLHLAQLVEQEWLTQLLENIWPLLVRICEGHLKREIWRLRVEITYPTRVCFGLEVLRQSGAPSSSSQSPQSPLTRWPTFKEIATIVICCSPSSFRAPAAADHGVDPLLLLGGKFRRLISLKLVEILAT